MFALRKPTVTAVNDHVWLLNDNDEATGYVVAGHERALVIDTMIGYVDVRREAEALTDLPLTLVNTHGHGDHIGGNWSFSEAYLHPADFSLADEMLKVPEMQEAIRTLGLVFPSYTPLADGQVFDLGGCALQVYALPGHTSGEVVLLDREDRLLFSGDGIIEQLWMQLPESLPVAVQVESMERLLPLRGAFDFILSGHSRAPQDASLFDALLDAARELAAGETAEDVPYTWSGGVCRAHPYGAEPRKIVYQD